MSRMSDYDGDETYNNQYELFQANARRALRGKRGKKALAELREALLHLPEKRLIAGALCNVGAVERTEAEAKGHQYGEWRVKDAQALKDREGEGVCAIGAYLWWRNVQRGDDPASAFAKLPLILETDDGDGLHETAEQARAVGMAYSLAWQLAYRNDEEYARMTPERRYAEFLAWIDEELATAA